MARRAFLVIRTFPQSLAIIAIGTAVCAMFWTDRGLAGGKMGFSSLAIEESSDSACAPVDWAAYDASCAPWVTARAGALAMHRSSHQSHEILWEQATGRPLLSTADVNPEWAAGAEVDLWLRLTQDWDFEFDWFSLGNWSRGYLVDIGGAVVQPLGAPLTSASLHSSSNLDNFEFNLRYRLNDRICLLGGFRYIELSDYLNIHYEDTVSGLTEDAAIAERNRLYGFQVGSQAALWQSGPWQLDAWAKAGIFGNEARSGVDIAFSGIPITLPSLRARASDAAFVGDLGLRASRRFGRRLQVYGGYRIMFFDGVALTTHQVDAITSFFSSGVSAIDTGGSPFYHGAELGAIFSF